MIIEADITKDNVENYPWDKITDVIGSINLYGYEKDFYAPLLRNVGMVRMTEPTDDKRYLYEATHIRALRDDILARGINLYGFKHGFYAPLLECVSGWLSIGSEEVCLPNLRIVGRMLSIDNRTLDLILPSLTMLGGDLFPLTPCNMYFPKLTLIRGKLRIHYIENQFHATSLQNCPCIIARHFEGRKITYFHRPYIVLSTIPHEDFLIHEVLDSKMVDGTFGVNKGYVCEFEDNYVYGNSLENVLAKRIKFIYNINRQKELGIIK